MPCLTFERSPPLPCVYSAKFMTYVACLGCVTAHETRFCDGSTKPSWQLCAKHQGMNNRNQPTFDRDMLQFLQEDVYDGSIPKPLPRPDFKHRKTEPNTSNWILTGMDKITDSFKPPTTHPITASLPVPGPRECANDNFLRMKSRYILWPVPTHKYAHSKSCSSNPSACFTTSSSLAIDKTESPPTVKILTSPEAIRRMEAHHEAKAAFLRRETWRHWEESSDLDEDMERRILEIREELSTTRVAKALFFRRCGGAYVNALGWHWEELEDDNDKCGPIEKMNGVHILNPANFRNGNVKTGNENDVFGLFTDDTRPRENAVSNGFQHHDLLGSNFENGTNGSDELKIMEIHQDATDSVHEEHHPTTSLSKALAVKPLNAELKAAPPTASNRPELLPNNDYGVPILSTGNSIKANVEDNTKANIKPTTHQPTKIASSRLIARQNLVHSSAFHDEEDLILTCWIWCRSKPSQPHPGV